MVNFKQLLGKKQPVPVVQTESLTPQQRKQQEEKQLSAQATVLEEERIFREGVISIKDLIAPSSMEVKPTYVHLGDKFVRTVFAVGYPRHISLGWFAPIINMSVPLDIAMYYYPVRSDIILKQLRTKVGNLEAQLIADREKGAPRDPIRETALRDIEQLRDNLTQGVEHFFQFGLYVSIYADSKEKLDALTDDIEALFGSRLVYSRKALYQAEQGFNSTLPLANDELMITFNMNSSPIASSFPFISSDLSSDNGVLYGINRHNNSLVLFDRFSLQNANTCVFATSGAGKSYAIKLEVLRSMMLGTDVIVIDPEKEYKHLSDAVGGTYINISLSSKSKINPFDLPRPVGEVNTGDIIRSAIITLKGLMRLMLGEINPKEDSIIDRALLETYAKKDITPDSDLSQIEPPIMQDFLEVLEGMEGGADLAERLKKYTDGTFAGLFNSPTNVDMKNQLVTFSVRDLEDELRPGTLYVLN